MNTERVKAHIKEHLVQYTVAVAAVTAGITVLVMRSAASERSIQGDIVVLAKGANGVFGKKTILNSVSYISNNRQGPPSWVVRIKETGEIFASQKAAAMAKGLDERHISNHLNGTRDHVDGFHFERICMAA